mmetsp:Transcript_13542/g.36579  ORF Transcript_13542/g.36579 Transcript_13542/m.36579 type:complete len:393 (-) Transcript_13542:556-1734(-)
MHRKRADSADHVIIFVQKLQRECSAIHPADKMWQRFVPCEVDARVVARALHLFMPLGVLLFLLQVHGDRVLGVRADDLGNGVQIEAALYELVDHGEESRMDWQVWEFELLNVTRFAFLAQLRPVTIPLQPRTPTDAFPYKFRVEAIAFVQLYLQKRHRLSWAGLPFGRTVQHVEPLRLNVEFRRYAHVDWVVDVKHVSVHARRVKHDPSLMAARRARSFSPLGHHLPNGVVWRQHPKQTHEVPREDPPSVLAEDLSLEALVAVVHHKKHAGVAAGPLRVRGTHDSASSRLLCADPQRAIRVGAETADVQGLPIHAGEVPPAENAHSQNAQCLKARTLEYVDVVLAASVKPKAFVGQNEPSTHPVVHCALHLLFHSRIMCNGSEASESERDLR